MSRIADGFVQELLAKVDIIELISTFVVLKKNGANYSGLCPFHNEKSPSFTVSPKKQFYHCFGCGAHGDAINFIMQRDNLGFLDAIEVIASRFGIVVPRTKEESKTFSQNKAVYEVLGLACDYYKRNLRVSKKAIDYFKDRGVTGNSAKDFALGFATEAWDGFYKLVVNDRDKLNAAINAGLIVKGKNGYYDRFRNRIVFPIRDRRSRVLGFGARVLDDSLPKYLNSPETIVFHKSEVLYGIYEASQYKRSEFKRAIVVEGYMDVVALHQTGVTGALATLGTAVTAEHVKQLFKQKLEIVFCLDADNAGIKAANKTLEIVLPLVEDGKKIFYLFLPDGEDPDSFVSKYGKDEFSRQADKAMPLSDFVFNYIEQQAGLNSIENRAQYIGIAKSLFDLMPDSLFKEMMIDRLSDKLKIKRYLLLKQLNGSFKDNGVQQSEKEVLIPKPLALVVTMLIEYPKLCKHAKDINIKLLRSKVASIFDKILSLIEREGITNKEEMFTGLAGEKSLQKLYEKTKPWIDKMPLETIEEEFKAAISKVIKEDKIRHTSFLLDKAKTGSLNTEEQAKLNELLTTK